jgi:Arc/MetJ-type ribon-helix-helix transcriptional regulator
VKLSVSIPDDDVAFLDAYASDHALSSRSAVVQRAIVLLRAAQLGPAYAAAWADWEDEARWDAAVADGIQQGPS